MFQRSFFRSNNLNQVLSQNGMEKTRPRILVFADYYSPAYKAGGPVRTISNMVDQLSDRFQFMIITRDRDLGDKKPFPGILIRSWAAVGSALVYYVPPNRLHLPRVAAIMRATPHDVLYLNSFFSPKMTGLPLLCRLMRTAVRKPLIIAPRGEFSQGALALKAAKKKLYIRMVRMIGLCRDAVWQASSGAEYEDITRIMGKIANNIVVAPDMLTARPEAPSKGGARQPGPLRLVFLSRISPKKNLDYLLRVLHRVGQPMELTICGPAEDQLYWSVCKKLLYDMPNHVSARYIGPVSPAMVSETFGEHDLFVFPTRGENFGHVIFEALNAGTPVVLSENTPWEADEQGGCEVIPLSDFEGYVRAIDRWAQFSSEQLRKRRSAAKAHALSALDNEGRKKANLAMFERALGYSLPN